MAVDPTLTGDLGYGVTLVAAQPFGARSIVLVGWAALLAIHVPLAVTRNHRLIRAVEGVPKLRLGVGRFF